jgi:hypothetical protein
LNFQEFEKRLKLQFLNVNENNPAHTKKAEKTVLTYLAEGHLDVGRLSSALGPHPQGNALLVLQISLPAVKELGVADVEVPPGSHFAEFPDFCPVLGQARDQTRKHECRG